MDAALSAAQWQLALLYLHDIALIYRSTAEHIDQVQHVITLFRDLGAISNLR